MFLYLVLGTIFGFVLSRSGAADYNYIQGMFLFERFQLYGIIGAAVAFTVPGLWVVKRFGRTASGDLISIPRKSLNPGTVFGSLLFGVGWSMTGMCPGPIFVNVGEGKVYAIAALAGALAGASVFGMLFPRLQRLFGLPRIASVSPAGAAASN